MSISEEGQKKGIRNAEYEGQNSKIDKIWGSIWELEGAAPKMPWLGREHERSMEKFNNLNELKVTQDPCNRK